MKSRAKKLDICKCGHKLEEHEICDCPCCVEGVHGCYAKIRKGNNNDFCECEDYDPRKV